jgi:predicted nucleic acid-binding protein
VVAHLDSSVVVASLLGEPNRLDLGTISGTLYASDLLAVEVRRVLHRLRLDGQLTDDELADRFMELASVESSITFVDLSREVLLRASAPFGTHVRTLDAIHLATAELNAADVGDGEPVTFVTHDVRLAGAARAMGFSLLGVALPDPPRRRPPKRTSGARPRT